MATTGRNGAQFAIQLEEFARETGLAMDQVVRHVAMRAFVSVVKKSPVDTGRFRGNWQLSKNSPDPGIRVSWRLDKSGQLVIAEAQVVAESLRAGGMAYIFNGLPYGPVLEFGGYPSPPEHGTWRRGKGFEVRSAGGFSKQAPQGMVRLTVIELHRFMREAIASVRSKRQSNGAAGGA